MVLAAQWKALVRTDGVAIVAAYKIGVIVFNDGHCTLGCHTLNISDTGALVMRADALLCPSEFVLKPRVGPPRDCEVVWRKDDKLGVRFV